MEQTNYPLPETSLLPIALDMESYAIDYPEWAHTFNYWADAIQIQSLIVKLETKLCDFDYSYRNYVDLIRDYYEHIERYCNQLSEQDVCNLKMHIQHLRFGINMIRAEINGTYNRLLKIGDQYYNGTH